MSAQIIKPETQSALLKVFGRNKQDYLAVSVLSMFELTEKPELAQEQDLWTQVQPILAKGEVFDGEHCRHDRRLACRTPHFSNAS